MDKLILALKEAFATNFQYYTKAHGFHVNIVGDDFYELHLLLEKIYDDSQDAIDTYAEHIRALGDIAPFNSKRIKDLGEIADSDVAPTDPMSMLQELYDDTDILIEKLKDVYDLAQPEREYGLQTFLADRLVAHRKFCWMLRASLEGGED